MVLKKSFRALGAIKSIEKRGVIVHGTYFNATIAVYVTLNLRLGKDEVGGSNPPSSSIETLESVGIQGFSIFFQFVEKQHIPTLLPTNICSGQFFCIAAISSLAISGLF